MTGQSLFDNRYLNSPTGEWTSEDPSGLTPDSNRYRFVGNAPTDSADPFGLEAAPTANVANVNQQKVLNGVPVKKVADLSGPDVTDWLAKDLVDQLFYRAQEKAHWYSGPGLVGEFAVPRYALNDTSTPNSNKLSAFRKYNRPLGLHVTKQVQL